MAATRLPDQNSPTNAPTVTKEFVPGVGERTVEEWPLGTPTDIDAKYETAKAAAIAGTDNIANVTYRGREGRASLVIRYGREAGDVAEYGDEVQVIEELYAVDVIRDMRLAPYFSPKEPDGDDLTNKQMAFVKRCTSMGYDEDEIEKYVYDQGLDSDHLYANWTAKMKSLYGHLNRGEDYYETGFVLRRSLYGLRSSRINVNFTGINKVADGKEGHAEKPFFKSPMDSLVALLPPGEWLYRTPGTEHLGQGRWRVTEEWQWAPGWSIVYDGTLTYEDAT